MNKLFTALKLNPVVGTVTTGLSLLTGAIPIPIWMLILAGAAFLYTQIAYIGATANVAKEKAAHQATIGEYEHKAASAEARYRALEHQTQASLALMQADLTEEHARAEKLEDDVAAAVLRGERRMRASVCTAGRGGLSDHAAASPVVAEGADDGARRIGAAVRRLAEGDAEIRYLRSYADACQRTCGPAGTVK